MLLLLPELRAYARFLVRRTGDADDLVQDAVLRALAALPQFQPGTSLRAWIFTILRNTFFEQARRRTTERAVLDAASGQAESMAPRQSGHMELSDLARHLFTLPPLLREALVLVGAAAICAVPVGTMKARVSRARNLLAQRMGGADGSGAPA